MERKIMSEYRFRRYCSACHRKMTLSDYFKVHNSLWNTICKPKDMLCFFCFEDKLGRTLVETDFSDIKMSFTDSVLNGKTPQQWRFNHYLNWKTENSTLVPISS